MGIFINLQNSKTLVLPTQKWICFKSSMRFLVRSARQRDEWCNGSSKKEKVKLREKLRLVTGCRGGSRGGRRWGNPLRLTCDPSSSPPAKNTHGSCWQKLLLLGWCCFVVFILLLCKCSQYWMLMNLQHYNSKSEILASWSQVVNFKCGLQFLC